MKTISLKTITIGMMLVVACSTLLFVSSCEKNDPAMGSTNFKIPKHNASLSYQVDASTAGRLHNECLDQIAQNISDPQNLGSMDHFDEQKGIVENFYNDNSLSFPSYLDQNLIEGTIGQIKNGTLLDDLEAQNKISAAVKGELENIFSTMENATSSTEAATGLNAFIQNISNSSYSDDEKSLLIGTANVGISTWQFWEEANNNSGSLWHDASVPPAGSTGWAGKFNWKLFGDCCGFVAGFGLGGGVLGGVAVGGMVSACITN